MACSQPSTLSSGPGRPGQDRTRARPGEDGFIRHPRDYPLQYRHLWLDRWLHADPVARASLGILFEAPAAIPAGSRIEFQIPLRGRTQAFRGEVVLVRARGDRHEIGVWLDNAADADRAALVERICQLESYLKVPARAADKPGVGRLLGAQAWFGLFGSGAATH